MGFLPYPNLYESNFVISDPTSTGGRSSFCCQIHRPGRSDRAPSSFGEVILPSAIQLLLGDDRDFTVRFTTLVGAIGHLRRLKRLFVILVGSKYCFTPEITSCSLRPTDPLLNNWFKVQPINLNPSRANEKVEPLVQDLDSVLKETTYLLSQKWVGVNFVLHPMSLAIHLVLFLKWEAYWTSDDELPHLCRSKNTTE
ncbi:hypothetical protein E5676_scaffold602G00570 [Cucumis melo var. makuwa]|uniref:Uncharacterized protein n=1 Tax=Cucumis melo var. makuwa TaxID=1194695 RepID=A0A5A7VH14_CUCMM|nr:hypothetical protein E6C27_scaffold21G004630 [Cucumis melo var. makuwa]TYK00897.1 hypothetical protein E5676_scaffold602G00570 [Cucumis melo var. makuwa]